MLREIKRSASSSSNNNNNGVVKGGGQMVNSANATAAAMMGGNAATSPQEVSRLNKEVTVLKEQMQSMTTKMDDLTSLVKDMKVSSPPPPQEHQEEVQCGNKRKKLANTTTTAAATTTTTSTTANTAVKLDQDIEMMSFPDLEDAATTLLPDLALSSGPSSSFAPSPILSRSSSLNHDVMDREEEDFVDELFHAFATDEELAPPLPPPSNDDNRPDPQLMKRIEDSLATIPKTMHEMVANRLIDAIAEGNSSSSSSSCSSGSSSSRSSSVDAVSPSSVSIPTIASSDAGDVMEKTLHSPSSSIIPESATDATTTTTNEAEKATIPLPLAVATLKTILADYGLKVECRSSSEDANLHRRLSNKSLPLVPIHA